MSESITHNKLVIQIIHKCKQLVGDDRSSLIMADGVDGYIMPPLTSEGYRPDVYYEYNGMMIIGEAKTSKDIYRVHSKQQYESYIKKCSCYTGSAVFVVAVHWSDKAAMHNLLRKISKKYNGTYRIVILEGF